MKSYNLKLFLPLIIVGFSLWATYSSAQTTPQHCQTKEAPKLRGFFLGQTVAEINLLIPGFQEGYSDKRSEPISPIAKEAGVTAVVHSPFLFYKRPGVRQVPSKEFEDADFSWHFFEGKLYFLVIQHIVNDPPNLSNFIREVSEKGHLPVKGWALKDKFHASIKCARFKVEL